MLMLGTNNSQANTVVEIVDGITAVVNEIHRQSPQTKILLLGIFPRGDKPNPQWDKIKRVNAAIAKLDDGGRRVQYLDIGAKFLLSDGTIDKDLMPDYLHLSAQGFQVWAEAVKGPIRRLLGRE